LHRLATRAEKQAVCLHAAIGLALSASYDARQFSETTYEAWRTNDVWQ
jgi:hypothetical protein